MDHSSWSGPPDSAMDHPIPTTALSDKKPRHRHTPSQLESLNELFARAEHPSLDERSSLAQRLGMETKTVNAWFQNKRASTKKKNKTAGPDSSLHDLPPIASLLGSNPSSASHSPQQLDELDEFVDDDHLDNSGGGPSPLVAALDDPKRQSLFYAGNAEHRHFFAEAETMPRKMRMRNRPSTEQTDELRKLYRSNPHPSKEDREALGERIGMTLKSITNWFQNQRSQAKKRKEEEEAAEAATAQNYKTYVLNSSHDPTPYSALPPASNHPSLSVSLPPPSSHPSLPLAVKARELPSLTIPARASTETSPSSRRSTPRRSSTPYHTASTTLSRPRRTRPEPFQLEELKKLNLKTSNPSIEERTALALEIGMDVGKVTNWFRNLRQTARKRAKRVGLDDDGDRDDDSLAGHNFDFGSISRPETPSPHSSASSANGGADDNMDVDEQYDDDDDVHSDVGSEDEHQEAVTPSPNASPSPPASFNGTSGRSRHESRRPRDSVGMVVDPVSYAQLEKVTAANFTGVKVEDALLLLSFHKHVVS